MERRCRDLKRIYRDDLRDCEDGGPGNWGSIAGARLDAGIGYS